jgi:hypothetical protein
MRKTLPLLTPVSKEMKPLMAESISNHYCHTTSCNQQLLLRT